MARKRTFSIIVDGETFGKLCDMNLTIAFARQFLAHRKSVIVKDNATRRTIARFIYGHAQQG